MKLTVIILGALLATVFAKPAAHKRRANSFQDRTLRKKALSLLHDLERREDGEEGSVSGIYSYPASSALECAEKEVFCSEDGEDVCVRLGLCDGYSTCSDGEDEADCENFECFEGSSKMCGASGPCVADESRCDGHADCKETHVDELDCPEALQLNCSSYEGLDQCPGENTCIHDSSLCDDSNDCLDGSDEADCDGELQYKRALAKKANYGSGSGKRNFHGSGSGMMHYGSGSAKRNFIRKITNKRGECTEEEWQCASGDECIDINWVCQGGDYANWPDCSDGSDEADCETKCATLGRHWCTTTEESEYQGQTRCLEVEQRCTGETVCADGSDEQNCKDYECPEDYTKCEVDDETCYMDVDCEAGKRNVGSGSGSGKRALGSGSGSGKRAIGSGSGSGKRAFGSGSGERRLSTEAAEKRMLKEKLNRLLEALNED